MFWIELLSYQKVRFSTYLPWELWSTIAGTPCIRSFGYYSSTLKNGYIRYQASAFFPTYCIFSSFSQVEREVHEDLCWSHEGAASSSPASLRSKSCTEVRRYAVVALTNLTFGNGRIKSFLCGFPGFIPLMVAQLARSTSDNLRKATAHLFRNLAWKADKSSKQTLSESNVVSVLMQAAITSHPIEPESKEEPTLKVILSALWNLSAHCKKNKVKFYCNFFVPLPTFFFLSTIWRHHVLSQCLKMT